MKPKVLAVVPARAGSKRLFQKNIKLLNGKPLVAYTFEAIQSSKYITATIATSDCSEVLKISQQYKNTISLSRPEYLASDSASSIDVLMHAVSYAAELLDFDLICLLQPTSPLRTTQDIDNAIELCINKKAKGVVSMAECEHSPLWSTRLDEPERFESFIDNLTNARSQDLPTYYQLNGAIYLVEKEIFLTKKKLFFKEDFYPFIMSRDNSVDIDNELDFLVAENILARANV